MNWRGTKNFGDQWTYKGVWESILQSDAIRGVIVTFIEWYEGTEIEPSYEFGDFFINLTREYTQQFKIV